MKSTPDGKKKELFHVESRFLMLELPEARVKKPKGGTKAIRELVGYAMFRFDQEENNDGVKEDVLYMYVGSSLFGERLNVAKRYELQVGEKYRSQGIGQMLLEGLDSLQKQSGLDKMMLSVLKSASSHCLPLVLTATIDNRAVNFYKRHGCVQGRLKVNTHFAA
jgi:GNAT superfamily N-acetyltransferase